MNIVLKIVTGIIQKINSIIDSIDLRTQETIRRAFFFLIFILCIIAISIGYNMGVDSARIKSKPLAEHVNDTFKLDIKQEKNNADFSNLLESEIVSESTVDNFKKNSFAIKKENLPEKSNDLFIEKSKPIERFETFNDKESPIDPKTKIDSKPIIVQALKKTANKDKSQNIIIQKSEVTKRLNRKEDTSNQKNLIFKSKEDIVK